MVGGDRPFFCLGHFYQNGPAAALSCYLQRLFTVDQVFDPDYRRWGGADWWQNTRLPYWSMLYSGDYDQMASLFKMYIDALPGVLRPKLRLDTGSGSDLRIHDRIAAD